MFTEATYTEKLVQFGRAVLLSTIITLMAAPVTWATTRFYEGNVEVQSWYRMRHTFQTDGTEHFDWVQWRNEVFIWGIWHNFVRRGHLLDVVPIPFVQSAEVNARYQLRLDPVYYLRDHYRNLYNKNERANFFKPQDLFRDLFIDLDHGTLGPGELSSRWGYQTIVWGEMDLVRSLDVINPLRLDQSFGVGERLDELRMPILAVKFLYDIGNVGETFSEVGIEGWFSPRTLDPNSHTKLIVEDAWRLPFEMKDCLTPDGQVVPYRPENCANARKFMPYRPGWLGRRRQVNPWSIVTTGPQSQDMQQDYLCVDYARGICQPDLPGQRFSVIYNIPKSYTHKLQNNFNWPGSLAGGIRLLAKTGFGVDFTLNYIFQPSGTWGWTDFNKPTRVYGDPDFPGMPEQYAGMPRAGTFEEGLRHCLSPSGRANESRPEQMQQNTVIVGADLRGYDWPQRRLDATGAPLRAAKQKQAARLPITLCTSSSSSVLKWNHIIGFTATYNDYDYTGAVFRLEESVTVDDHWHRWIGNPRSAEPFKKFPKVLYEMPVWRHGLGIDYIQGYASFPGMGWMRTLPGELGRFASSQQAVTFQWLLLYRPELANHLDPNVGAAGIQPMQVPPFRGGVRRPQWHHWENLFTLGTGGVYKKFEHRMAFLYEPSGKQPFLFGQWFWHGFYGTPIDLSLGTAWKLGSRHNLSWSGLYLTSERDLLWFEATYYLL
ncbi:MAG TPA: DUF1302 family protein [Methylomirabilota bacterium]|jgi:hypothetical protein|nr:DUF1302 family protein [Methylomirabilota bacterium]